MSNSIQPLFHISRIEYHFIHQFPMNTRKGAIFLFLLSVPSASPSLFNIFHDLGNDVAVSLPVQKIEEITLHASRDFEEARP